MIVDFFLFEKVAATRLRQRCVEDYAGDLYYRMKDRKGSVRLSRQDWDDINQHFTDSVQPTTKALKWSINLTFPFSIAVLALICAIPPLKWALEQLPDLAFAVLWVCITVFLPVTAMLRHSNAVRGAIDRIEQELRSRPRCDPPYARPRGLNTLEILALVVAGPHLLIEIYGSIDPNAYRNTPLSGTHLDLLGVIGLCVLAGIGFYRWQDSRRWRGEGIDPDATRRIDPLARARGADDQHGRAPLAAAGTAKQLQE